MRTDPGISRILERISDPRSGPPTGSAAALSGALAASLVTAACGAGIESARSDKAEEELVALRDRSQSLHRDLVALVEHTAQAAEAIAGARIDPGREDSDIVRLRALLFAAEVPLRTAESCHALLALSLRALSRTGVKAISEIGAGAALAWAGVVGGIVTARSFLADIPSGSGIGAASARKRAERILRDAEALRSQIIDRVRQHLP